MAPFPSAMAKSAGPRLPLVTKALLGAHSSVYEVQRVTSTAFLAEVGTACSGLLPGARAAQPEPLPRPRVVLRGHRQVYGPLGHAWRHPCCVLCRAPAAGLGWIRSRGRGWDRPRARRGRQLASQRAGDHAARQGGADGLARPGDPGGAGGHSASAHSCSAAAWRTTCCSWSRCWTTWRPGRRTRVPACGGRCSAAWPTLPLAPLIRSAGRLARGALAMRTAERWPGDP